MCSRDIEDIFKKEEFISYDKLNSFMKQFLNIVSDSDSTSDIDKKFNKIKRENKINPSKRQLRNIFSKNYSKSIDVNYQRVKLQGNFLYDKQSFLYSLNDKGKPGYDVVTPMLTTTNEYVLINRGWIEKKFKNDLKINNFKENQIKGIISLPLS